MKSVIFGNKVISSRIGTVVPKIVDGGFTFLIESKQAKVNKKFAFSIRLGRFWCFEHTKFRSNDTKRKGDCERRTGVRLVRRNRRYSPTRNKYVYRNRIIIYYLTDWLPFIWRSTPGRYWQAAIRKMSLSFPKHWCAHNTSPLLCIFYCNLDHCAYHDIVISVSKSQLDKQKARKVHTNTKYSWISFRIWAFIIIIYARRWMAGITMNKHICIISKGIAL